MTKRVSVAEARARFSALLDEVLHGGERYVIERRGKQVAALVPIELLKRFEAVAPTAERPLGALALVGLLACRGGRDRRVHRTHLREPGKGRRPFR